MEELFKGKSQKKIFSDNCNLKNNKSIMNKEWGELWRDNKTIAKTVLN